MNTPIADFVRGYEKKNMTRLHMPGHKGTQVLGCEAFDITEVRGADELYAADGIIAESEANATQLFGTGRTLYSTEGSSQCMRAMLYLALTNRKSEHNSEQRETVVATRNAHKTFIYAAAVLDLDVLWLWPEGDMHSICSCQISPEALENTLKSMKEPPVAVYVTSPDYLGNQLDIRGLAEICHKYNTILAVDNAHGAYLRFLNPSRHPIDLGADICCDSAHKTLPVLTGGAYLQISKDAPEGFMANARQAMALFGSTSPSYLILTSLDLCNQYLADGYRERLVDTIKEIENLRQELRQAGWNVEDTEALKLVIAAPDGSSGSELAGKLWKDNIECEYADSEYVVCMLTPENTSEDLMQIKAVLGKNEFSYEVRQAMDIVKCEQTMSIREAVFAKHEEIPVSEALGRVCGTPTVSCPPAIPIVVSGEVINEKAIEMFLHYGITSIDVVKE